MSSLTLCHATHGHLNRRKRARVTEPLRRSTHLVSINWPVPWHRRAVDPIGVNPDPVPAVLGSAFPLHICSSRPFSPFLRHCVGPAPSISLLSDSQEPTESSTSQPIGSVASLSQWFESCWVREPIKDRECVPWTIKCPMGDEKRKLHFATPPGLVVSVSDHSTGKTAGGALVFDLSKRYF